MINPIWNSTEQRVRTFWRFVALFVATLIASVGVYSGLGPALELDPLAVRLAYVAAALLGLFAVRRWADRRSISSLGLSTENVASAARRLFVGTAASVAGITGLVAVLAAVGLLSLRPGIGGAAEGASATAVALGVGALALRYAFSAFYEEVLCRGYLLTNFREGFAGLGPKAASAIAIGLSSVLFALMHVGNPGGEAVIALVNLTLMGVILAFLVRWTGSIWTSVGVHFGWNTFLGPIFGLPVSGSSPAHSLFAAEAGSTALITGGAFGPEAGIGATLTLVVMAILLHRFTARPSKARSSKEAVADRGVAAEPVLVSGTAVRAGR